MRIFCHPMARLPFLRSGIHPDSAALAGSLRRRRNASAALPCPSKPEEGVPLSLSQFFHMAANTTLPSSILVSQAVSKIQLTGGGPTIRSDILPPWQSIGSLRSHSLRDLRIANNKVSPHRKLHNMVESGLAGLTSSSNTQDSPKFQAITQGRVFDAIQQNVDRLPELNSLGGKSEYELHGIAMNEPHARQIISFINITRENSHGAPLDDSMHFHREKCYRAKMLNEKKQINDFGMIAKRKAKHSGIGKLAPIQNRPKILLGESRDTYPLDHSKRVVPFNVVTLYESSLTKQSTVDPVPPSLSNQPLTTRRLLPRQVPEGRNALHRPLTTCWQLRRISSSRWLRSSDDETKKRKANLTHVSESGSAHMVSISQKAVTARIATAACAVSFSNDEAINLIRENQMKKGDVLGVARVAGIMAAKRTPDLIPLCHPIPISRASVDLEIVGPCKIEICATVTCDGKTGVEMEALMAASTAALTVYDMCKAVDKGMVVEDLRVTLKDGGKSGKWEMT